MKLPDWVDESRGAVRIFCGVELVAKRINPESPWQVKTVRCNFCGECCKAKRSGWMADTVGVKPNGDCGALVEDEPGHYVCGLGSSRPFMCCAYGGTEEECCIRWEDMTT